MGEKKKRNTQLKYKVGDGQLLTGNISEQLKKSINIYHFLPHLKIGSHIRNKNINVKKEKTMSMNHNFGQVPIFDQQEISSDIPHCLQAIAEQILQP